MKRLARVGICILGLAGLCAAQGSGRTKGSPGRGSVANASSGAADPNAPKGLYPTSHGVLKSISGSQLFVELDDEHEMKFRMTRKTKIYLQSKDAQGKDSAKEVKASSLEPGQVLDIDMQITLDGSFEAVRVTARSPKP